MAAASSAAACDRPLNTFVTIHWAALGLTDADSWPATQALMTRARDWLRDNGLPALWLWVREGDTATHRKGAHLHWLLYLPVERSRDFRRRAYRWVRQIAGSPPVRGGFDSRPIGGSVSAWVSGSDHFMANLRATLAYVLKGCRPCDAEAVNDSLCAIWAGSDTAKVYGGAGGIVWGKRAGMSAALRRYAGCLASIMYRS